MNDNKVTAETLAKQLGVSQGSIYAWRKGLRVGKQKDVDALRKLGIEAQDPRTKEERRQTTLKSILERQDNKNKPKRVYRKHINVPEILAQQVRSVLDGYVKQLGEQKTWSEFQEVRDQTTQQLVYLCKQGA